MNRCSKIWVVGILVASVARAEAVPAGAPAPRLADCPDQVKRHPDRLDSYRCYWQSARRELKFKEAMALLQTILDADPENHRARMFLGFIHGDLKTGKEEGIVRRALDGMTARQDREGAFWAHLFLFYLLTDQGKVEAASDELDGARRLAQQAGDAVMIHEARYWTGWLASYKGEYGKAWVIFKQLENNFPAGMRPGFDAAVLDGLANTAHALGRYGEALRYYQQELAAIKVVGSPVWEASIAYSIALSADSVRVPREFSEAELLAFMQAALDAAERSQDRASIGKAHLLLGQCKALGLSSRAAHLEQALELTRQGGLEKGVVSAQTNLAVVRLMMDPQKAGAAFELIDRAIELADAQDRTQQVAIGWSVRSEMRWQVGPRAEAIQDSLVTLEAIERAESLQSDPLMSAQVADLYAQIVRRLSSYLLDPARGEVTPAELDQAFQIMERVRGKLLLRQLDSPAPRAKGDRAKLQEKIAQVQRQLVRPGLGPAERRARLGELERLEVARTALVEEEPVPATGTLRPRDRSEIRTLPEIQAALAPDQALLAFQVESLTSRRRAFWVAGSWSILLTRDGARRHRIADEPELESLIEMFLGLIERRDGSEARVASQLYQILLAAPIRDLPPGVHRLIVVPDVSLFKLPFVALRPDAQAAPIGASYLVSVAPSASLWHHWQGGRRNRPNMPVLALADPTLPQITRDAEVRAAGLFRNGLELGRLAHARDEARAVVDRIGGERSQIHVGEGASEHLLKTMPLGEFGLIHLAAHAVVDGEHPLRSAVVLAAGDPKEDGLLQVPEIAELDLDGAAVILSACSSASGTVFEGEGPMSLARSFFQAGARAVVGNLWPQRDDEAAELIGEVATRLGEGLSLGEALSAVQRDWILAGRPAASWAGIVLQGDADLVPSPGSKGTASGITWIGILAGLLLAVGLVLVARARRSHV